MSTHRRLTLAVLVAAGVVGACQEKIVNIVAVSVVQVSGGDGMLLPGGSVQLTATPRDDQNHTLTNRSVSWSSSNSGVATVNGTGLVTAVSVGSATITAQVEGVSGQVSIAVNNPVPNLASLAPDNAIVNAPAFELTVTGTGFVPGAVVVWGSQDRTTQYVSATTLKASITAADIAMTGSFNVTVRNPAPGGGTSAAKSFAVNNPLPVITSLSPDSSYWIDSPIVGATMTVTGTGFVPGSVVRWQGTNQSTIYLSPTSVRISLTLALLNVPGLYDVTVSNPAPGGGTSAAKQFMVRIMTPGPFISAGRYSTCAVRGNGEAYCWGFNDRGQLGDGTTTDRSTPGRVATTLPLTSIVVGAGHACGLTRWGAAYCWGSGGGNSSTWTSTTPLPVSGGLAFIQLAAGHWHTCGVTYAGGLYCWGDNYRGRLGDGTTTPRQTPVPVGSGTSWRKVFAGGAHTCALDAVQRLYCWGANYDGQLGDGTTTDHLTPMPVSGGVLYTAAALSNSHTCAVAATGAAWCWGASGLLGTDSWSSSKLPVAVAGGQLFRSITAGDNHTCGLTQAGAVWCWGFGGNGQLGTGATWWAAGPINIALPPVRDITAGWIHSCAMTTAGAAYCWGDRTFGALGDGVFAVRPSPVTVSGGAAGYTAVDAGQEFSCGLAGTSARCWGFNTSGQLGDNSSSNRTSPVTVAGGHAFTQITTGGRHACALTAAGEAYCWGEGTSGQLGNGSSTSPVPVAVSGGYRFSVLDAGDYHTCGVTTAGELKCWGANDVSQLGDGTSTNRNVPTPVAGVAGFTFARVSASAHHSCAVTTTGQLYCWGRNENGEIGDGTQNNRAVPVRVNVAGATVTAVATGAIHTCAITTGGTYCWGFNGIGELGTGSSSPTPVLTPVLVQGGLTFRSLTLQHQRTCGITTSGVAYCWGMNDWGQLGTGSLSWPSQPTQVGSGTLWTDLHLGAMHTCGVTTAGAAQCWGRNRWGELGTGITGTVLSPAPVQGGVVFNEAPCLGDACAVAGPSLRVSSRFTRGVAGLSHIRPLPRAEPVRPVECSNPDRACKLQLVR